MTEKPQTPKTTEYIARVQAIAAEHKARTPAVTPPAAETKPQLPLWPDLERAIPNHLARTCLFAPIGRGRRKMHDGTQLASPQGTSVTFSGKQLDMADQDVFLQAMHIAKNSPLGTPIMVNRARFLAEIGRTDGKSAYDWLDESFGRQVGATLTLETDRIKAHLPLVAGWIQDKESGNFQITMHPEVVKLFSRQEYSLIDWELRKQITRRVDLSKWLQTYVASHSPGATHSISVSHLKDWCGNSGRARDFRSALGEALEELERLSLIANHKFYRNDIMVQWFRPKTSA
jgi:hypothetical protein